MWTCVTFTVCSARLSVSGKRTVTKGVCAGWSSRYMTPSKPSILACTEPSVVMVLLMDMVYCEAVVSDTEIPCTVSTAASIFCWAILGIATKMLCEIDQRCGSRELDGRNLHQDGDQDGDEDEDVEMARLRRMVQEWRAEAARKGEPLRLPRMPFMLRNIWMAAMILFTVLTFSTAFITTLTQGIIMVSLVGICWAVACWVPFAIIMEASLFTFTFKLKLSSKILPRISSLKSLALMPNPRLLIPRLSEVLIVVTLVITSATYPHPLSIGGDGQMSAHPSYDDTL